MRLNSNSMLRLKKQLSLTHLRQNYSQRNTQQQQTRNLLEIEERYSSEGLTPHLAKLCSQFVPKAKPDSSSHKLEELTEMIRDSERLFVLTGAGLSTESGIPDYRSEGVGLYARSTNRPVKYQEFVKSPQTRRRYWARNYVGWPSFSSFLPNIGHKILADWERLDKIFWLVTQNVDGLHFKAGSKNITELHGSSHRVMCITKDCSFKSSRDELQNLIELQNPDWSAISQEIAPDGDVQLSQEQVDGFQMPVCPSCGNDTLKPEVVFFGDNVNRKIVDFVFEKVEESDGVLVVGSSLEVYSGYRFVSRAADKKKPISIINIGAGRGDKHADLIVRDKCGSVLQQISSRLFPKHYKT
ncbi:NAD-dependent protein lipoamidase sirtuin-4, mitochondrial-like [Tubulanus polymorphus]|uniref:NAD-dependent protein lipoamidase sirtuin-4, mitochondrial-like n=1 Tax=Tubulanus polymorphus TaxID=672921 RepID=UPI003DA65243